MKRILMILTFLAVAAGASAQYKTAVSNDVPQWNEDYAKKWKEANDMRTAGIVLTSTGIASCVAGPVLYFIGFAKVLGSGIGSGIAGDPGGVVGEGELISGLVLTSAGGAMLCTGIPLWCIGGKKRQKLSESSPAIALGPCPNGVGLSFRF